MNICKEIQFKSYTETAPLLHSHGTAKDKATPGIVVLGNNQKRAKQLASPMKISCKEMQFKSYKELETAPLLHPHGTAKDKATRGIVVLGNTQKRTKQLTSPMKISCKEMQFKPSKGTAPLLGPNENVIRDSVSILDCQEDLNDLVQAQVKLLFPEFFAPDAATRLDQNKAILDGCQYTDPIILSWLKMFGARV